MNIKSIWRSTNAGSLRMYLLGMMITHSILHVLIRDKRHQSQTCYSSIYTTALNCLPVQKTVKSEPRIDGHPITKLETPAENK